MARKPNTAIVVGASRGLGAACVRELAAGGCRVAAVSRDEERLADLRESLDPGGSGQVLTYAHDVTKYEEAPALFQRMVEDLGGLDLIIYNAGIMPRIDPDTYNFEKDRRVLEVNLVGCVSWLNCAAPLFRNQGSGSIVGISSIAGDRGRRGYPVYNTSKAGMNTFLEALRNRLHRHGVRVTTVKPGFLETDMTEGLAGLFWLCPPEKAAARIIAAAERGAHTCYVPWRWSLVGLVIRCIPSIIFRRMKI